MKGSWRIGLVALVVAYCCSPPPCLAVSTTEFRDAIRINKDTSLDVVEEISLNANGEFARNVTRTFPLQYVGRDGKTYHVKVFLHEVKDEHGLPMASTTQHLNGDLVIKLGDPDEQVTGIKQYFLHYTVRGAFDFSDPRPELYWVVPGFEWPYAIDEARADLYVPPTIKLQPKDVELGQGYSPQAETTSKAFQLTDGLAFIGQKLEPGQALVMQVKFPVGSIEKPSVLQHWLWHLNDWWLMYFLPALTGMVLFLLWWEGGRDQRDSGPCDWKPPAGLRPAEIGTIVDERCDKSNLAATLLDLAIRGHFNILELSQPDAAWSSGKDYELIRNAPPAKDEPTGWEQGVLRALFPHDQPGIKRRLSDARLQTDPALMALSDNIYQSLMNKGMFRQNPNNVRKTYRSIAFVLAAGGCLLLISADFSAGLGLLFSALFVALMASAMPAKSVAGSRAADWALAFQHFLHQDKNTVREAIGSDVAAPMGLLPYAFVLNVSDQWAEAFMTDVKEPPHWYDSNKDKQPDSEFDGAAFVHDVGGFLTLTQSALPPVDAVEVKAFRGLANGGSW